MEASLSSDEFQRMQEQLIDLRTKNYTLGEKNIQIQTELLKNGKVCEDLQRDLAKCQKIISRSKNAKDVQLLLQENEALQGKLQMQEDEFRLQNETLMHEVASLISSNKEFSNKIDFYKSQKQIPSNSKAEQLKIKLEAENIALKNIIKNFENSSDSSSGKQSFEESQSVDLKINLSVLIEEKTLLEQKIHKIENEYRENLLEKENELNKYIDKLKKKQESFVQLQSEKENLYIENKENLLNLESFKNAEIQQLKEQIKMIQSNLKKVLQLNESTVEENPVSYTPDSTVQFFEEMAVFECSFNETKQSIISIEKKMYTLSSQLAEFRKKNEYLESCNEEFKCEVGDLKKENLKLEQFIQEQSKLVEHRKRLIDEMNEHMLEITTKHSTEIENLSKKLSDEQAAFRNMFDKENDTNLQLIESKKEIHLLKKKLEQSQSDNLLYNNRIHDIEEKLSFVSELHKKTIDELSNKHVLDIQNVRQSFIEEIKDLKIQLEVCRAERNEFEEKNAQLLQKANDYTDDRKIQEKKGIAMVKDLKRQLNMERNRSEKLQERLQEILNNQGEIIEEIALPANVSEKLKGDTGSISSWSYVSGGTAEQENKDTALPSDSFSESRESPNHQLPNCLENETSNLLCKIASLQQKNWTLEEKVNHLELGNEGLIDDVLKKTAIIQFYCMEGRNELHLSGAQDKLTIKRIVDFIKDKGDENLKEINRRMQRMLEETLTKNMYLQKDIETLSNEVSRLSKLACSSIENEIQNFH